ncbi:DUF192 domain-containing protein [Pengzhenrongella sicca]|uniref:DUF192 domain-containing protein n=1 Tax=Pengzhenrongella sicca TaxID=2819238 RepID=A0A8A4ZK25_9MICO|nr:DUF192 domain-containing protein [Pengzhenrongella sicca]QTE29948.1 DUF192 domain-containing protein [Pengzhenrongella sicca]
MDGAVVAPILVAQTYAARLRGLIGRRVLPDALLLRPANSVHGVGMLVSIDVAVLDSRGTVLVTKVLRPFGMTRPHRGGDAVVEAPRGSFARWGLTAGAVATIEIRG